MSHFILYISCFYYGFCCTNKHLVKNLWWLFWWQHSTYFYGPWSFLQRTSTFWGHSQFPWYEWQSVMVEKCFSCLKNEDKKSLMRSMVLQLQISDKMQTDNVSLMTYPMGHAGQRHPHPNLPHEVCNGLISRLVNVANDKWWNVRGHW